MTTIISLMAAPGAGKSTIAAKLFATMKEKGYNVELAREYVKAWAYENRKPVNYDQFYFFGKQCRQEYSLFNKVDYVVTDSPILVNCYYGQVYGTPQQATLFDQMHATYMNMCAQEGHTHKFFFIKRVRPYVAIGRFQTELESDAIDVDMRAYCSKLDIQTIDVPGDPTAAEIILSHIVGDAI